nr:retrovirus-related Pol polyprotein from transposon TNT 1-94 [Tanacetum cinerariifolium]
MWSGQPSDYGMLRIFGCVAYPHDKQGKLEPRAVKYVLLGYPKGVKGYRLYRLDDESTKIVTSRNVVFNESVMCKDTLKDSGVGADKSIEELHVEVELHRLNNHTPDEDQSDQEDGDDKDAGDQETDQTSDLTNYQKNKIWELVDHPAGQKLVSCKWLFKIKEWSKGVQKPRYKPKLITRGFTQRPSIDYNEVFSLVVLHTSIRVVLALTACKDYELEQLDVKKTFLHGNLEEVIYMRLPLGYKQGIPTASDEFPLPEDFPTASEEMFPLLRSNISRITSGIRACREALIRRRITPKSHPYSSQIHSEMEHSNHTIAKILILDTRKFEQWKFRIQQYLQNKHYALWEVIEFGDSYEAPQDDTTTGSASEGSAKKKGRTVAVMTEDMQKRRNDVKARTTLLLALPDEHQLRFNKYKTAQELWAAILKTFGGNKATRKTKKNQLQAIVSHLEFMDVEIEQDDLNQKLLTSLAPEWLMHTIIDKDDIEEIDIKWNMALLSMRADKFWKKTGKKNSIQCTDVAGFDKSKVECFNYHKMGHFARECRAPRSQDRGRRENYKQGSKEEEQAPKALMAIDGNFPWWPNPVLIVRPSPSIESNSNDLQNNSSSVFENGESTSSIISKPEIKFVKAADSPTVIKTSKDETVRKPSAKYAEITPMRINRPHMNDAQPKRTYFPKLAHSYVSRPFQRKSAVKTQFRVPRVPTVNRKFPTGNSKVSTADLGNKGKVVKASACWIWKPKQNSTAKGPNSNSVSVIFKKYQYIDTLGKLNGCSWHMTGNISYLSDYKPYDGGYVSFGQGGCKITGKETIKTGKLEFKNVYFMKDLKYNLFSVSQICDNKNSVLFTDSECIVLGRDFKLRDDTNVLLKTPRQHNMYSIDLNNIVPYNDLTCLVVKASADESELWHRKLGHLNFKTMN